MIFHEATKILPMNALKIVLKIVWNILALVGLLVVAGAAYLWFVDPLHLKPILFPAPAGDVATATPSTASSTQTAAGSRGTTPTPQLTPQQQTAANYLGLDPNAVSALLNPTTEACAVAALGQARVNEIKAGAAPTAVDIYAARHCLVQ